MAKIPRAAEISENLRYGQCYKLSIPVSKQVGNSHSLFKYLVVINYVLYTFSMNSLITLIYKQHLCLTC